MSDVSVSARRRTGHALALVLPVLLAGCARYVARPIDPARSAASLTARRLDDPKLQRFLAAMGRARLGDGAVTPVVRRYGIGALALVVVFERPDLRIAVAGQAAAHGGLAVATALPNPVLGLSPTYNGAAGFPSPIKIGPIVTFVVDSFGARAADAAAARQAIIAARVAIDRAAWRERAAVRDALLAVWRARRIAAVAQENATNAGALRGVLEQRFAAGLIAAPALDSGQIGAQQAAFALTEANRRIGLATARLAGAIGMPAAALRGVRLDTSAFDRSEPVHDIATLTRAALVAHPAIQAALARYRASQDRLRAAIDRQYPGFTIGPGYHYDQGSNKFILAFSIPLPVFNQNQGPIAIARARRRKAGAQFEAVQLRVLAAIDQAMADRDGSDRVLAAARRASTSATRAAASAARLFHAGAIGRLRLLEARQQVIAARQNEVAALALRATAIGHLEDALHHRLFRSTT